MNKSVGYIESHDFCYFPCIIFHYRMVEKNFVILHHQNIAAMSWVAEGEDVL